MAKAKKWGGKREGSGRKPKDPTVTISFRVPLKYAESLRAILKKAITTYLKKHKDA